jgi:BirA family transcriptional regulator, biotin operon repressor / biotin---[acetyl-CoA-carboxylase] ligase
VQHSSPLSPHAIQSFLTTRSLGRRVEWRDGIDSTNREGVALGQADVEHGTLVVADSQTAGRGRLAREWFSPPGINLYCSIVIRTAIPVEHLSGWLSWLPLMTALAAAEAIETEAGSSIAVKWPNDLLIAGRKAGGILCESASAAHSGPFQVIGIGLNVNGERSDFPEEWRETATTIRHEAGRVIDRNRLLAKVLQELESCMDEFISGGLKRIAHAYRRRCATIGTIVNARLPDGQECIGLAESIGQDGSLTLVPRPASQEGPAPEVRKLRAADIVHLRS